MSEISIHALLAESDNLAFHAALKHAAFLSTLSLRRATNDAINGCNSDFISIHALLAESDARRASRQQPAGISIHALLAESDVGASSKRYKNYDFYPRSPCGERHQNK